MSREWKPGDVAMLDLTPRGLGHRRAIWSGGGWDDCAGALWRGDDAKPRPLVVIDPEDREQVAAFVSAVKPCKGSPHSCINSGCITDRLQTTLRGLIIPPKPEEPTGLGAVVEDADGIEWVRSDNPNFPWYCNRFGPCKWLAIAAVKVLSEGVTQ